MSDTTSIKHPAPLTSGDFTAAEEPFALFGEWFAEAAKAEPNDPNAMALATVDADGLPDVRMVLMKGYDSAGFVFYSHIASQKGRELAANPKAALLFHWKSLRRQVRIRGTVSPVSDAEADAYFATRPKQAQIGAWASKQSQPLESRFAFEQAIALVAAKHIVGEVPRPPGWSGWRIAPSRFEFWHDRPYRLHDRIEFRRDAPAQPWTRTRLYPEQAAAAATRPAIAANERPVMTTSSNNGPRRTLLLTGASRGIGHATVIRFSSAGWRVITCSRHPFPEDCPWDAGPEDHIQVDLADHADTTRAISEIRERLEGGALHALVNNAAISPKAEGGARLGSIDTDIETWSHVFRVNFFAPIMMARGLIDELKAVKGSVVNVTSIAGSRVHPFAGAAYATSKAALASLTREMASDFGRLGIRVNSIAPGEIDTSILSPGTEKIVEQQIPLRRLGTPDEVAKIIYVLCTETSSYVNGAEIHINGGQHV